MGRKKEGAVEGKKGGVRECKLVEKRKGKICN